MFHPFPKPVREYAIGPCPNPNRREYNSIGAANQRGRGQEIPGGAWTDAARSALFNQERFSIC